MNRDKMLMAGSSLVFLILLGVSVVFLAKGRGAVKEVLVKRDAALRDLRRLYDADPFPSDENTVLMRTESERLSAIRGAFTNELVGRNIGKEYLSPSRFIQVLQEAIRDRMQATAPIVEGSRVIPAGFNFGFDRYMEVGSPMPRSVDVPRLAQQLAMVELLVEQVYSSQVALVKIQRDQFDSPQSDEGGGSRLGGRTRLRAGMDGGTDFGMYKGRYYSAQRFRMEVRGRQSAIETLLNKLAAMDLFVIVTDIELGKARSDLRAPKSGSVDGEQDALAELSDKKVEQELVSKLPPSQRLVAGAEIDPPLQATIELDVLSFGKEEGGDE